MRINLFSGIFSHFFLRASVIQTISGVLLLVVILPLFNHFSAKMAAEQGRTFANSTLAATIDALYKNDYGSVVDYCIDVMKNTRNVQFIVFSKRSGEELIVSPNKWALEKKSLPYYLKQFDNSAESESVTQARQAQTNHLKDLFVPERTFEFHRPIIIGGQEWGVMTIGFSKEAYFSSVKSFYWIVIGFTIFSLLVSFYLFFVSSRRVRNQIDTFGEIAGHLAVGELTFKAPESAIGEIGVLGKAINSMSLALKEKSERISELVKIVEQTNDAFVLVETSCGIVFANAALEKITGYSVSGLIGVSFATFVEKLSIESLDVLRYAALARTGTQKNQSHDVLIQRADKSVIDVEVRFEMISDVSGRAEYTLMVISDISERKDAEKALLKSEQHFRAYFERSMVGMAETSVEKGWITVNDRLCEMLGYARDELTRMNWAQITHPEDLQADVTEFNRVLAGEIDEYAMDKRFIHRDGHIIYAYIAVRSVRLDDNTIDYFVALVEDISERKLAERELRIAATAFESQEGIMVTDTKNRILRVNKTFSVVTGYEADEVIGKSPDILKSGRHDAAFYIDMWGGIQKNGAWEGELWNRRKSGEVYPQRLTITAVKDENGSVTNYVGTFSDITAYKDAENKIRSLAFFDPLTGLPNRRLLMDRLHQALASSARSGKDGALLFIDLDNFKTLNDTLGHDVGDELLKQVADRLRACIREGDTVARLGGDEFVVMLEGLDEQDIESASQAELVGNKILNAIDQPYQLGKHDYSNSSSIGATIFGSQPFTVDDLLKQADIAMYQAKKSGRNALRFFNPRMQEVINARVLLEAELIRALNEKQFQLHYQIQIDNTGKPLGAEVLIRWLHPERGFIPPLQFIPLAEEIDLIQPIGQWVLETACAQLEVWQHHPKTRDLMLSVNVSPRQFRNSEFVNHVQAVLKRYAINPGLLKLELTESLLLENVEDAVAIMEALGAMGIQFALDDFGTGYSSLQYLKRLPLYQLKIDQTFVHDVAINSSDQAIVRTIVAMAHGLNLNVIAEGVETEEQWQFLIKTGCTQYQGYLFSKPVPVHEFEALL